MGGAWLLFEWLWAEWIGPGRPQGSRKAGELWQRMRWSIAARFRHAGAPRSMQNVSMTNPVTQTVSCAAVPGGQRSASIASSMWVAGVGSSGEAAQVANRATCQVVSMT